jgi:hypothetical protein
MKTTSIFALHLNPGKELVGQLGEIDFCGFAIPAESK